MKKSRAERTQDLKEVAVYSALAVGSAATVYFVLRHFYKKIQFNSSQKHSIQEGDPATYAKQLKMAFDNDNYMGWGTNVKAVTKVFEELPSKKMYERVQKEYNKLYARSLNADLEDELNSDEYNKMIRLLNAKS